MADSFVEGGKGIILRLVPDLPFLEKLATDLGAQVEVGPGEDEAVRGVALGSKLCGGVCKFVANDACVIGHPPYLDC